MLYSRISHLANSNDFPSDLSFDKENLLLQYSTVFGPKSASLNFALLLNTHSLPYPFALESLLQIRSHEIYAVLQHRKIVLSLYHDIQIIPYQRHASELIRPSWGRVSFGHEVAGRSVRRRRKLGRVVFRSHCACAEKRPGESLSRLLFNELVIWLVGWEEGQTGRNRIRTILLSSQASVEHLLVN